MAKTTTANYSQSINLNKPEDEDHTVKKGNKLLHKSKC